MQSQKSERSYQDYLSVCESDFLNTYFLQIVGDSIPTYVCQSELEMRNKLKESKLDIQAMLQQKKSLYVKPNRFVFANCDFQLEEAMNQIKQQIQKYDYQDEDKKSSQTRKQLYKSLITSSFSDDIPICQVNSWVVLNDVKLKVQRGDIIVFIVKIKASSYTLNRLQTLIYNEIQYTKSKLVDYCQRYQPKLHPILILNADINFPYQKLNCQAYYVGKQNLMYHFFQQMRVKNTSEAITEAFITKHNINRMSQSRLMYHRWETDYKSQAKSGLFKKKTYKMSLLNMNENDTLSLLLRKREKMAQNHSLQARNRLIQQKRNQFPRVRIIQDIQRLLGDQPSDALQYLLNILDDDMDNDDISYPFMLYYWGVLADLVELLKEAQNLTEAQLVDLTKLIAYIVQCREASQSFINQKAQHFIEVLLANHTNIVVIENCILIIGNLDNYEISDYFRNIVIPRLKNFLFQMQPLSTVCLVNLSWMVKNINFPQHETIQKELILLQNEEVLFEAIQHADVFDIYAELMRFLIKNVDFLGDPTYIQPKLMIEAICNNLTPQNAIDEIPELINKCLNRSHIMILSCAFKLAQNYMIQSRKPYYSEFVDTQVTKLLDIFESKKYAQYNLALKSMMQYLETFHIQFPESRFSIKFYQVFMDTLKPEHLRLLSILVFSNLELIKNIADYATHKRKLQEMQLDEATELLRKIYS